MPPGETLLLQLHPNHAPLLLLLLRMVLLQTPQQDTTAAISSSGTAWYICTAAAT
jgi:hypothetical protein